MPKGAADELCENGVATISYAREAIAFLAGVLYRADNDEAGALAWMLYEELGHGLEALNRERLERIEEHAELARLRAKGGAA